MKKISIILYVSLALNLILAYVIFTNAKTATKNKLALDYKPSLNIDLSDKYNFQKIFIEKNDSVYRSVYNKSFEDNPVNAFLLACSYYVITNDTIHKKDVIMANTELEAIFGKSPSIIFPK